MAGAEQFMSSNKAALFLDISKSPVLSRFKKFLAKKQYKKTLSFIKDTPKKFINIFAENIYGTWLLRGWASLAGYFLLFASSLGVLFIADTHEYTRQFIHAVNANEAVIGAFTIMLALLIPLAIALIQGDGDNSFTRQAMVRTIVRFGSVVVALVFICVFLFIPSGIHVLGESLTLKNLYVPVLVCCAVFIIASFYRSIRWLSDESSYGFKSSEDGNKQTGDVYGFSSYRFARIMRLLQGANFQTWMAIWSQRFPIGYEDTIHEAFFKRANDVVSNKKRKQYRTLSLELQAYNDNFDNRNQLSPKFEYQNPEKFFILFSKVEKILSENYVDSRLDGLWSGKDALKNISIKIIDSLMDSRRIWSLFQSMNKYIVDRDILKISGNEMKGDELVRTFLFSMFNAIKDDKISAHDALSEVTADSGWAVTYEHLYGDERYNLSFLVEQLYREWLNELLDKANDKDYFLFNDSIVEHIFPSTDPITMGKLYWLLHLAHSSDYLNLWIKERRPIGLANFSGGFEFVGEKTKEDMWKEFRERTNVQEFNSIKLFCSRHFRYLRTDFMKLAENLEIAKSMDRSKLSDTETARLDDFISLAQLIEDFYANSDKEREKASKAKKSKKDRTQ